MLGLSYEVSKIVPTGPNRVISVKVV